MSSTEPAPEFSRLISADQLGAGETVERLSPTERERRALAERFELDSLDRLEATVRLRRRPGGVIEARGHLEAVLAQPCVVTLDPVPATLSEDFRVLFAPEADLAGAEVIINPEQDAPEPLLDGRIDLGELVAQQLGLALDPYPRSPGAVLEAATDPSGGAGKPSPFADLARLRGHPK